MNIDGIEKMLLHPILTKIGDDGEKPTYTSVKQLWDELISNDGDIPSDFGKGSNGHLFLVVSDEECTKVTAETKSITPMKPIKPTPASGRINTRQNPVDYNIVKEEFHEHNASKATFLQYTNFHWVS